jgi:hypothetical protein
MRFAEAVRHAEMVMRSLRDCQAGISHNSTVRMGVLHQVVVDCTQRVLAESRHVEMASCTFSSTRLDNEDILSSHALLDLDPRLAALELVQQRLCRRYAEVVADGPTRE